MKQIAIKENHLFLKAYAKGKKYVGKYIVVYILPDFSAERLRKANPQKQTVNRIGLTATKKLGGAVQRNRCRRVMRAAYRILIKRRPLKTGFIIVTVARHPALSAKSYRLEKDYETAFEKLGMFKD